MLKMISRSISDVEIYRKKYAAVNSLSESAYQVLACFKEHPEIRLTTKKIIEYTELPRRTVTYSLGQLAEYSLIQKYGQGAGVRYQLSF
jgi:DNA-binding MarR family transcriptional regulator